MRFRAGLFVTGTDTGVGKTLVSAALVRLARSWGLRAAGFKPFAAGCVPGEPNEDVAALVEATGAQALGGTPGLGAREIGPVQLIAACAPTVAAAREGRRLSLAEIEDAMVQLNAHADCVIVEGVGGFDVPLSESWSTADLARELGLPVLLVVGMRLGCMNHAILTARAIQAEGLRLSGWVANTLDPDMLFLDETLLDLQGVLQQRFQAPYLGKIPRLDPRSSCDPFHFIHADALRPYLEAV